jgi:hypothetical protein
MGQFESLLWERHPRDASRRRDALPPRRSDANPLTEWTARPLGRLGRPLVAEIETYLQFFAIARS